VPRTLSSDPSKSSTANHVKCTTAPLSQACNPHCSSCPCHVDDRGQGWFKSARAGEKERKVFSSSNRILRALCVYPSPLFARLLLRGQVLRGSILCPALDLPMIRICKGHRNAHNCCTCNAAPHHSRRNHDMLDSTQSADVLFQMPRPRPATSPVCSRVCCPAVGLGLAATRLASGSPL
jgi:hypothetical protein